MGHMLSSVSSSTSTDYCFSPLTTCPITVLSSAVSVLEELWSLGSTLQSGPHERALLPAAPAQLAASGPARESPTGRGWVGSRPD